MNTLFDISEIQSGADFSRCRTWRYALWRIWDHDGLLERVMFIGLNPSKADEKKNDTTISKCMEFAKLWGYGGIYMLNLFAFRATNPKNMIAAADPVGQGNDEAFVRYRERAGLIIAAWGGIEPRYRPRVHWESRIEKVCAAISRPMECLGRRDDGEPRHPSRLGYATKRELYWRPAA